MHAREKTCFVCMRHASAIAIARSIRAIIAKSKRSRLQLAVRVAAVTNKLAKLQSYATILSKSFHAIYVDISWCTTGHSVHGEVMRKMTQNTDRPQPITLFALWPYTWSPYDHTFFYWIRPMTQKNSSIRIMTIFFIVNLTVGKCSRTIFLSSASFGFTDWGF